MRTYTSNSERSSALCEFRWLLRYGLGLEVPGDAYAMSVGKAWHEVMEVYWIHGYEAGISRARALAMDDRLVPMTGDRIGLDLLEAMLERYDQFHENCIKLNGQLTILGQEVPIERATQVNGRWSTASRWMGIIDKIVRDDEGQIWILEHKSTGIHPTQWLEDHQTDYQPRIYAWLLRALDLYPVGCIYDVVRRGGFREPRRNKDGSLSKVRAGTLPRLSAQDWLDCLTVEEESIDWVRDVHRRLITRDAEGYWQVRRFIRFESGEVDRAAAEAHTVATRLRRHRKAIEPLRSSLDENPPRSPHELGDRVTKIVRQVWGQFPRNVGECKRWGRMCEYVEACSNPTITTCSELRIRANTTRNAENVRIATQRSTDGCFSESGSTNRTGNS